MSVLEHAPPGGAELQDGTGEVSNLHDPDPILGLDRQLFHILKFRRVGDRFGAGLGRRCVDHQAGVVPVSAGQTADSIWKH